jgi:hypothetical protein
MDFLDRLKGAIEAGQLREPFTVREAVEGMSHPDWPLERVRSFLVRHCEGNLAASRVVVERVTFGRYRLVPDAPRRRAPGPRRSFRPPEA